MVYGSFDKRVKIIYVRYHVTGHEQCLEEDSLQHGQLKDPGDPNNQKTKCLNNILKFKSTQSSFGFP